MVLPYLYTTPTFLVEGGVDLGTLGVNEVWRLIRKASLRINAVTAQAFIANYGTLYLSGRNSPLLRSPGSLPVQELVSIEVLAEPTHHKGFHLDAFQVVVPWEDAFQAGCGDGTGVLVPEGYAAHTRAIEKKYGVFPGGTKNVKVTGSFGWMDNYARVETDVETDIDSDSVDAVLTSVSGFYPRDVVDLIGESDVARIIVTGVSRATRTITFDPIGTRALADTMAGGATTARRLGQVPEAIEDAAQYIFTMLQSERRDVADGDVPIDVTRLRKESTDGYSYELFPQSATSPMFTGSPAVDQILMAYSRPAEVLLV